MLVVVHQAGASGQAHHGEAQVGEALDQSGEAEGANGVLQSLQGFRLLVLPEGIRKEVRKGTSSRARRGGADSGR